MTNRIAAPSTVDRAALARLEDHRDLIVNAIRGHGDTDLTATPLPDDPAERDELVVLLACRAAELDGRRDDLTDVHGTLSALELVDARTNGRAPGLAFGDQSRTELRATALSLAVILARVLAEYPDARGILDGYRVTALTRRRDILLAANNNETTEA